MIQIKYLGFVNKNGSNKSKKKYFYTIKFTYKTTSKIFYLGIVFLL